MATSASFGDIDFEVYSTEFRSIDRSAKYKFAQHQKLIGKPTLQQVGGDLETLRLAFSLHPLAGDGKGQLDSLRELASEGTPKGFVLLNEYLGKFVITSLDDRPVHYSLTTGEQVVEYRMSLLEYVGEAVEAQEQTQDRTEYSEAV